MENNCIFCNIIFKEKSKLIQENDEIATFFALSKDSAVEHILVCSKNHIKNVNHLTKDDYQLILNMKKICIDLLKELHPNEKEADFKMGFHYPPFNSINHLHLHGIILPIKNFFYKYIASWLCFRDIDVVLRDLKKLQN